PLGEDFGPRVMTVTVKGVLGMIPGLGGLLAEVAGQFIPQQRLERLEVYGRHLSARLDPANACHIERDGVKSDAIA
ncbi:MAG: hypothetical protein M3Q74_10930, partial [Pseudomonadota bacterium]|nr:hypothetical protein [Pseudomonadota bacterium]